MLSAAASLGMILLWDVDGGLTQIDKYLYSSEDYIKVHTYSITHTHIVSGVCVLTGIRVHLSSVRGTVGVWYCEFRCS